jgi:hypothetical protein
MTIATVMKLLIAVAIALAILSYSGQIAARAFDWHPERDIVSFFNMDRERNLPTTFQMLLFFSCAVSLAGITVVKRLTHDRWTRHWGLLSLVFLLLAWDEIAEIHERLIEPIRRAFDLQGLLFFGWIVPAGIAVLLFGLYYVRFVSSLEAGTRNLVILSGAVFLSGALVLEAIGGWYYERIDQNADMIYVSMATIEESLEMAGLILFLYALLRYLSAILPLGRIEIGGQPGRLWIDAVRNEAVPEHDYSQTGDRDASPSAVGAVRRSRKTGQ